MRVILLAAAVLAVSANAEAQNTGNNPATVISGTGSGIYQNSDPDDYNGENKIVQDPNSKTKTVITPEGKVEERKTRGNTVTKSTGATSKDPTYR